MILVSADFVPAGTIDDGLVLQDFRGADVAHHQGNGEGVFRGRGCGWNGYSEIFDRPPAETTAQGGRSKNSQR
jgi:hypothetical protein